MIRNEVEKFKILTLAERPDLADQIDGLFAASWPEFMRHDQVADEYFLYLEQLFPQFQFFLLEEGGKVIAAGNVIPFYWDGTPEGLPSGWDDVLIRGWRNTIEVGSQTPRLPFPLLLIPPSVDRESASEWLRP